MPKNQLAQANLMQVASTSYIYMYMHVHLYGFVLHEEFSCHCQHKVIINGQLSDWLQAA